MRGASLRVLDHIEQDAAEQLVRESAGADLLVIGSRSDASTATLRFDAIARTLAHRAQCPVMFVPAAGDVTDLSDVVCGIDRSTGSAAALRWAARESAMRGGTVLAEQVLPRPVGYGEELSESLSSWVFAQRIKEPTTIMCRLVWGASPATDLAHTAMQRGALLVVGSHRSDGGHLHRCITGRLAGHTSVPVVVVPPEIPTPRMAL